MRASVLILCVFLPANFVFAGPNGAAFTAVNPLNTGASVAETEAAQKAAAFQSERLRSFVPRDPWRVINGETNYVKLTGREFCGKVVDVSSDGIRIEGEFGDVFSHYYPASGFSDTSLAEHGYSDFWVANFPFEVVSGQIISSDEHLMAWAVGTYSYNTVQGGSRTIKKLDYGVPCAPPPPSPQQIAAIKAKQELDRKRAAQGQVKAREWLLTQATNGSASAQCSLGLHYLTGEGGEVNRDLAIYWLKKASDQGDREASNKLVSLKN